MVLNQRDFLDISVDGESLALIDYLPTTSRWHHALIQVSGGSIRWLAIADRSPTSAIGNYVGAGGKIEWLTPDVDYAGLIYHAKFTKASPTNAKLEVSLFW